jgi:hypothetical protein
MSHDLALFLAGGHIPEPHRAVRAGPNQGLAVAEESHAGDVAVRLQASPLPGGGNVIAAHDPVAVAAAHGEERAVGRERQRLDPTDAGLQALGRAKGTHQLAGAGVPQVGSTIPTARDYRRAVRREADGRDGATVPEAHASQTSNGALRQRIAVPVRSRHDGSGNRDFGSAG